MSKSGRSTLLRVGISAGLLFLLFRFVVEPEAVVASIQLALGRPRDMALAVLLYCVFGSLVRGLRWQALVHGLGHPVSLWRTTELFFVGTFFNQFLPTGMGGDVVRALTLAKDGIGRARAASTVLVDRAIGLLPLLAVGLLALPMVRDHAQPAVAATLLLVGLGGLVGLLMLFRINDWIDMARRLPVVGRLLERPGIVRFTDSFADYSRGGLMRAAFWGLVFAGLLIGANAGLGRAVGITQMNLFDWAIFVPLVALSTMLPSIGGWGVREVLYAGLLSTLPEPVPAADATALSLMFGGMNLLLAAIGGVLTGMGSAVGLPKLGRLMREAQEEEEREGEEEGDVRS